MGEFDNSVMIALLPVSSEWARQALPHMTLVYCGELPDLKPSDKNEMAKVVHDLAFAFSSFEVDVIGTELFPSGHNDAGFVEILLLRKTQKLTHMRAAVEHWNASEYMFKPHVTVGRMGLMPDKTPRTIRFNRVMLSWGKDNYTEWFQGQDNPYEQEFEEVAVYVRPN